MTPNELRNKKFNRGLGFGYKVDEVDDYLEYMAGYFESLIDENNTLNEKLMVLADKINEYKNNEDGIKNAILGAQSLGNSMITRSKSEAQTITSEARLQAEIMVDNAKRDVEREANELARIKEEADSFRNTLFEMYKAHLEVIRKNPLIEESTTQEALAESQLEPEAPQRNIDAVEEQPFATNIEKEDSDIFQNLDSSHEDDLIEELLQEN